MKQQRRKKRVRAKVQGTTQRPRLSVFRSNRYVYIQLIDDTTGKTIFGISPKQLEEKEKLTRTEAAKKLGVRIAELSKEKKITHVVFDRGSYKYHGIVKAIAEGAREGGLVF